MLYIYWKNRNINIYIYIYKYFNFSNLYLKHIYGKTMRKLYVVQRFLWSLLFNDWLVVAMGYVHSNSSVWSQRLSFSEKDDGHPFTPISEREIQRRPMKTQQRKKRKTAIAE